MKRSKRKGLRHARRPKPWRSWLFRFATLFVSLAVCLGALELAVRRGLLSLEVQPLNIYQHDELLGWRAKSHLDQHFEMAELRMHVVTNEEGFRDEEHDNEEQEDTVRIIGIGDSFLFGFGIDRPDNVLVKIADLVGMDPNTQNSVDTINLSMPGYNVNQYYQLLTRKSARYAPNVVIMFMYMNDFKRDSKYDYGGATKSGFMTSRSETGATSASRVYSTTKAFVKDNFKSYFVVRHHLKRLLQRLHVLPLPLDIELFRKDNELRTHYAHTFRLLTESEKYCSERQIDFVLAIIPNRAQTDLAYRQQLLSYYNVKASEYDWTVPQMALANFCITNGIHCIDLMSAMVEAGARDSVYFPTDNHWNRNGHHVAAQRIYSYLRDHGII